MAEAATAVGLVASIATLVDLELKITAQLHDFTNQTSDVPESFRSLAQRLSLLTPTLKAIQQQADGGRFSTDVLTALQSPTQRIFTHLKVVETGLANIVPPSDDLGLYQTVEALQSLTKDGDIRVAVDQIHRDIDLLVTHQPIQHVNAGDRTLAAFASLQLGQAQAPSPIPYRGHTFGNVNVNDHGNVHLGNNYHIHPPPEPDLKVFGLCLGSAPLMEPDCFVGRAKELDEMAAILRPGEPAVEQRRFVLGGLGGIGKTQLVIAFARKYRASYRSIVWLNATSELTLAASLRLIVETLLTTSTMEKLDDQQVLTTVFRWLSDVRNTQWLLIYDNHDEPDRFQLTDYMPTTCNGTIVVTTRVPDLLPGRRMRQIRVQPFENLDESLQILENRSQRADLQYDSNARKLAKRLAGLPLALATAGAHLRKTNLTFGEYLEAYERRFNVYPRRPIQLEEYTDRTLHTTWDLTYYQLAKNDPVAADVLKLLAYFDNQEIWFELLHAGLRDDLPDWIQEVAGDHIDFENTMGTLVDYCLIEIQPFTRSYSMHNCVHDWTLAQLNQVQSKQMFWYTVECITASVDNNDWEALGQLRYARLTRHALRCAQGQFQQFISDIAISLDHLTQLALITEILRQQIQYREAEQMYAQALAGREKVLGPDHVLTLETVNNLGLLYFIQGKLAKAEQMYTRALAGKEKALGPDHISTLDTVVNFGVLYRAQGKLAEAEQMYTRALARYEKALGSDHISTLDTVNSLGVLYWYQGKHDQAEQMYERALAGREKVLGSNHTLTLDTVHNFGVLYSAQGKLADAEQMYARALAGCEKALGFDHTSTLDTVNALAILLQNQGRLEEAESMLQRALAGYQKQLGQQHPKTCAVRDNLVELHRGWGKEIDTTSIV